MRWSRLVAAFFFAACLAGCTPTPPRASSPDTVIDERSYRLGVIGAFAEIVGAGVKKLALSSPMTPGEMDALIADGERIAADNGALCYREEDFLVTDLFPAEITDGKQVLLIYNDPVKDQYMALKAEKKRLLAENRYQGKARKDVARKLGRLLSYPEEHIEKMLAGR